MDGGEWTYRMTQLLVSYVERLEEGRGQGWFPCFWVENLLNGQGRHHPRSGHGRRWGVDGPGRAVGRLWVQFPKDLSSGFKYRVRGEGGCLGDHQEELTLMPSALLYLQGKCKKWRSGTMAWTWKGGRRGGGMRSWKSDQKWCQQRSISKKPRKERVSRRKEEMKLTRTQVCLGFSTCQALFYVLYRNYLITTQWRNVLLQPLFCKWRNLIHQETGSPKLPPTVRGIQCGEPAPQPVLSVQNNNNNKKQRGGSNRWTWLWRFLWPWWELFRSPMSP